MAEEHTHSENTGTTGLVVVGILVMMILMFMYFGTDVFRGGSYTPNIPVPPQSSGNNSEGGSINLDTPDKIDVNVDGPAPQK